MFNAVRMRLTALYLCASLLIVTLIGASAYKLLHYYFATTTDLALQHRMAHELTLLNMPVPAELVAADQRWSSNIARLIPSTPEQESPSQHARSDQQVDGEHDDAAQIEAEQTFDGELAAIFVLVVGNNGQLLPGGTTTPMQPDAAAFTAANQRGSDLRTVRLPSGAEVRLLSYRVESAGGPQVLQLGRTLIDQDRVLDALLVGLLTLGGASTFVLGGASYWLAGRSLRPAQRAWQHQQSFVANASHELRAPLTLLRASADVARRTTSDASQQQLLDDVLLECDHMARLVEDLLTLSRLDSRTLPILREPIDIQRFAEDIIRQVERVASAKQIAVASAVERAAVLVDPFHLRQVFLIVIDNALRYTPGGGTIHISSVARRDHILLSISDTGSGIAPEHLPHVFERFYRANSEHTEDYGAGIGLSLAQALMHAQGGTIEIASTLHQGTSITLTLPRA